MGLLCNKAFVVYPARQVVELYHEHLVYSANVVDAGLLQALSIISIVSENTLRSILLQRRSLCDQFRHTNNSRMTSADDPDKGFALWILTLQWFLETEFGRAVIDCLKLQPARDTPQWVCFVVYRARQVR